MPSFDRRDFLKTTAATVASLSAVTAAGAADRPGEKVVLAVMGVHGRGRDIVRGMSRFDDVEIAYVIDPDENVFPAALKAVDGKQKRTPKVEKDVRKVLEDKEVTALAIA